MLTKAIILVLSAFLVSSCITGPAEYFKKSANNKLFDRKGSRGGKRAPLYNKKYIAKAKQNVAISNYDEDDMIDDDLLENENISLANREMYREMLEKDIESKYIGPEREKKKNKAYLSLVKTSPRIDNDDETEKMALKAEIAQIKNMLKETKNEMANSRCPTAEQLEAAQAQAAQKAQDLKSKRMGNDKNINSNINKTGVNNSPPAPEATIIHPVKAI